MNVETKALQKQNAKLMKQNNDLQKKLNDTSRYCRVKDKEIKALEASKVVPVGDWEDRFIAECKRTCVNYSTVLPMVHQLLEQKEAEVRTELNQQAEGI